MQTSVYLGNRLVASCATEEEAKSLCRIYSAGTTDCVWSASNDRGTWNYRSGVDLSGEQLSIEECAVN